MGEIYKAFKQAYDKVDAVSGSFIDKFPPEHPMRLFRKIFQPLLTVMLCCAGAMCVLSVVAAVFS